MINRRFAVTGLTVLAAASLALTACTSGSTPSAAGSSSPSASASAVSPSAALTAALGSLKGTGFDFTLTEGVAGDGASGPGSYNPATQSATLSQKGSVQGVNAEIDATQIGSNIWAKVDLGTLNSQLGLPTSWMSVDETKITSDNLPFDFTGTDIFDMAGLLTSVSGLQQTSPTTITGTVDLTASTGTNAPDADSLTKDGAVAKTTPFTVTLDAQGRITALAIDASAYDKATSMAWTFSDYGSPAAITAPTGDVMAAPAAAYTFLNQD